MDEFIITMLESGGVLEISTENIALGSQYDNHAQKLVFKRPKGFENHNLILQFATSFNKFMPVYIGTSSEFKISNVLTQTTRLFLQVAFSSGDDVLEHSNIIGFTLRKSENGGISPIEPWPDPVKDLTESAFASMTYIDNELTFQNLLGEDKATVTITGGSGGTTDHAKLSNLEYSQSGHIGFASANDLAQKADVSAFTAHESNTALHTTQADKDAITTIPAKLEASNIKAGTNVTLAVSGNDVTISAAGGGTGTIDHALLINRDADDQHPISAITNLTAELGSKVDKVDGKGLSTNDLTDTLKAQYDSYAGQISTVDSKTNANATAIEGLHTDIAAKANIADVYSKAEADERFAAISDLSAATTRIAALESTVGTLNDALEARLEGDA